MTPVAQHLRADDSPDVSPPEYARAVLNILADFAAERDRYRETQRAMSNILEDYADEKERLKLVQRAAMNILADFGAEKLQLEATQKAMLNILGDFSDEKNELERTKKAVLNVLEDLAVEKNRLEESRKAVLQSEQALRASLHEKEVLLREVHHRVKNNLQLIASLLNLQARSLKDERSRTIIEESENRIHSIALVHEALYQRGDLTRIHLGDYVRTLAQQLLESWIGVPGRVALSIETAKVDVPVDIAISCGLIVNELLTNAFKHAFPDDRKGSVHVSIRSAWLQSGTQCVVGVADDGVGLPEHIEIGRSGGLGPELVATLARQLRGEVRITRDWGTTIEVTVQAAG